MKSALKCEIERQKAVHEKRIGPLGMLELSQIEDPEEYERSLILNHEGSKLHPKECRPCHFQAGLCWKGLTCPFCHICAKPKRKSKHQRDVDKRRAERYERVKESLGDECLRRLREIDEQRRLVMADSEKKKKIIKDAFSSNCKEQQIRALAPFRPQQGHHEQYDEPPKYYDGGLYQHGDTSVWQSQAASQASDKWSWPPWPNGYTGQ